jgi:serine/threonine protein kinase
MKFDDIKLYQKLGEGAFGTVRLGVHKSTGRGYAIKIQDISSDEWVEKIENEIEVSRKINLFVLLNCSGVHLNMILKVHMKDKLNNLSVYFICQMIHKIFFMRCSHLQTLVITYKTLAQNSLIKAFCMPSKKILN